MASDESPTPAAPAPLTSADRRRIALLLVPLGLITVLGMIGTGLAPTLLGQSPLGLIALSPTWPYLLLVAPVVKLPLLLAVAVPRLMLPAPTMFLLGRDYGDHAIEILAGYMGEQGDAIRRMAAGVRKAGWLGVFLWPAPIVCAIAGTARLSWAAFLSLFVVGRVIFLLMLRWFGASLSGPLDAFRAFVDRNSSVATVVTVALVMVFGLKALSKRRPVADDQG